MCILHKEKLYQIHASVGHLHVRIHAFIVGWYSDPDLTHFKIDILRHSNLAKKYANTQIIIIDIIPVWLLDIAVVG